MKNTPFNLNVIGSLLATVLLLSGCLKEKEKATDTVISDVSAEISSGAFSGASGAFNRITGVEINWQGALVPVRGYKIYRVEGKNKKVLASVGPEVRSFIDGETAWGNIYTYIVKAVDSQGKEDSNSKTAAALAWGGALRAIGVSRTSLRVYLQAEAPLADQIRIYEIKSDGSRSLLGSGAGTDSDITIENLEPAKTYKLLARAYIGSLNKEDGNDSPFTVRTLTFGYEDGETSFQYRGVMNVRAFGDSPNAPLSVSKPDMTPRDRIIEIAFPAFNTRGSGTIYSVVRTSEGSPLDTSTSVSCTADTLTSCRACLITAGSEPILTCRDTRIAAAPARYEYTIALVHSNAEGQQWTEPLPDENPQRFKIKIPVPPANMVLLQRDAVNYEICKTMAKVSDPKSNNRCPYLGVGATTYSSGPNKPPLNLTPGYYDFGYNLFLDRFEAACNWTPQSAGGKCGPLDGGGNPTDGNCFGDFAPTAAQGLEGQVFYRATTYGSASWCWIKRNGAWHNSGSWVNLNFSDLQPLITNDPGAQGGFRPPVNISLVNNAYAACQAQVDPAYGRKRLPRLREAVAAMAWPTTNGEPNYVTSTDIINMTRRGTYTGSKCSVDNNLINGVAMNYRTPLPASYANLLDPGNEILSWQSTSTTAAGYNSLIIGSRASVDCQSRYGAQDLIGNVAEFASDVIKTAIMDATNGRIQTGGPSPFDNGNRDLEGFLFDGKLGYGGNWPTATAGENPNYNNSSTQYITHLAVPLGLPLSLPTGSTLNSVYSPKSLVVSTSHVEALSFNWTATTDAYFARAISYGNYYLGSNGAGRWSLFFNSTRGDYTPYNWGSTGFRCGMAAD